jgi:putative nucleotidyltransferase with HDIG domain
MGRRRVDRSGMKTKSDPQYVDVAQLRVGMYVHLDVGWMGHPFPLSSFKIASADQISTIRELGMARVRYSPERSDPEVPLQPASMATLPVTEAANEAANEAARAEAEAREAGLRARRELLQRQQASLRQCERQFAEAAKAYRQAVDLCSAQPQTAREQSEALVDGFLNRMSCADEICIRLLSEGAGDRASTHALNVTVTSLLLGKAVGLEGQDLADLGVGALLHDIGKIELPDRVRYKDDAFSAAQARLYQEHVNHGVNLARKMNLSAGATLAIGQHHEHADGTGFPQRAKADRMTQAGRIIALVNRYDNLCNPPSPAQAMTPHEALSYIFAQMKARYDAAMLGAFIKMMGVYPPGSVVQLTDDRYALVVSVNSARPLKPRVVVHDVRVPRAECLVLDLEETPELGVRRSLKPQQLPRATLDYLSPRPRICYFFERARELAPPEAA